MARKTTNVRIKPKRVVVLVFDGAVLGDVAMPCELFDRATDVQGRALYDVRLCAMKRKVKMKHGSLAVPWRLSSLRGAHAVIVPGLEVLDHGAPPAVLRALSAAVARRVRVASICTGAFVLAATGVLDGLRATTHWRAAGELARRHPRVEVDPSVLYVDNGRLLTSAGAMAGVDLCLHLIRRDFGAEVAARVARASVTALERAGGQAQFIETPLPGADEASLGSVLAWLEVHLGDELSLRRIAKHTATSSRTLSRRFREQLGTTPAQWVAQARVRRAQRLLETTTRSIDQIAEDVGFGSSTVLRTHFSKTVGTSPLAWRRMFS